MLLVPTETVAVALLISGNIRVLVVQQVQQVPQALQVQLVQLVPMVH